MLIVELHSPYRARHRGGRVTSETRLKRAHDRLADACKGGLRRRRRTNSILDVVRLWIDGHLEELFAGFRMVRQRSVGKAKPVAIGRAANGVENTATIQRPESEMVDQDGDDRSDGDGRVSRERFDPADVEMLPGGECRSRPLEIGAAATDGDGQFVEVLSGRIGSDNANRTVGQRQVPGVD